MLIEKILEPGEKLPETFQCEGTTGYDALADVDRLFVDPAAEEYLNSLDARLRDEAEPADYHVMIHGTKRRIADGILRSEILRLSRLVPESSALPRLDVADALAEIICWFPIYRSYLPYGREVLEEAIANAASHRPELRSVLEGLQPLLLDTSGELARRFQQTSGMVMAKGVEDTAFFRYTRLGTLTEVGADPTEFAIAPEEFHERMARRQAELPLSMTTLSTHDTKRSEDARARITVIAESVPEWELFLGTVQELAPIPDGPLAALIWQAIAGAWTADRGRLQSYALKAAREAGNSTNWTDPDQEFERHLAAAVDAVFDVPEVEAALENFVAELEPYGTSNSLSAKIVQLTMPGVPDVYQGTEFRDGSLTDPDNRRPVDFDARISALAELDSGSQPEYTEEAAKLLVVSRALSCAGTVRNCSAVTVRCLSKVRLLPTQWRSTVETRSPAPSRLPRACPSAWPATVVGGARPSTCLAATRTSSPALPTRQAPLSWAHCWTSTPWRCWYRSTESATLRCPRLGAAHAWTACLN